MYRVIEKKVDAVRRKTFEVGTDNFFIPESVTSLKEKVEGIVKSLSAIEAIRYLVERALKNYALIYNDNGHEEAFRRAQRMIDTRFTLKAYTDIEDTTSLKNVQLFFEYSVLFFNFKAVYYLYDNSSNLVIDGIQTDNSESGFVILSHGDNKLIYIEPETFVRGNISLSEKSNEPSEDED